MFFDFVGYYEEFGNRDPFNKDPGIIHDLIAPLIVWAMGWSCQHPSSFFCPNPQALRPRAPKPEIWVAVEDLKLSDYKKETLLCTKYPHYGNLLQGH